MSDAEWFEANDVRSLEDLLPRQELQGTLARLELARRWCVKGDLRVELTRVESALTSTAELMVVREVGF